MFPPTHNSRFTHHMTPLSTVQPHSPAQARTTGLYSVEQAANLLGQSEGYIQYYLKRGRLNITFGGILGADIAHLMATMHQYEQLRARFGFEGSNEDITNQVNAQQSALLKLYSLQESLPLGAGVQTRILLHALSTGNQKKVMIGRFAIKHISGQDQYKAPGSDISGILMSEIPTVTEGDFKRSLDTLVGERNILVATNSSICDPVYGIHSRYLTAQK